jgi:hypothetical protein
MRSVTEESVYLFCTFAVKKKYDILMTVLLVDRNV